jgi:hypothetical protein
MPHMRRSPSIHNYINPGFHMIKPVSLNFTTIVSAVELNSTH